MTGGRFAIGRLSAGDRERQLWVGSRLCTIGSGGHSSPMKSVRNRASRPSISAASASVVAAIALNACDRTNEPIPPTVSQTEACEITLLALMANTSNDRPWRLWTHEPVSKNQHWRSEDILLQAQWHAIDPASGHAITVRGPSSVTAHAVVNTPPATGISCPSVRSAASEADNRFVHVRTTKTTDDDSDFAKVEVMIERAVVSPNGREAIVYLGREESPLSGLGELILFRKSPTGQWSEAARAGVWVS